MTTIKINTIEDCSEPQCCASLRACLPIKSACNQYFHLLKPCDELHNCNLCSGAKPYFLPFVSGDLIHFQLRLEDCLNTPSLPTVIPQIEIDEASGLPVVVLIPAFTTCEMLGGWEDANSAQSFLCAELWSFDDDGNAVMVSNVIKDFAGDWVVGFDRNGLPYQNLVVDTSKIDLQCFFIKVTYKCGNQELEFCSETYLKLPCEAGICIESVGGNCDGHYFGDGGQCWYGSNNFSYSNRIRIMGDIELINISQIRDLDENDHLNSYDKIEQYILRLYGLPEYVIRHLSMILEAETVSVNGEDYSINDAGLEKGISKGMYWFPTISLYKKCKSHSKKCIV